MCSHSLEDLIAGQIKAGFTIADMFEDVSDNDPIAEFLPVYFATLAEKNIRGLKEDHSGSEQQQ